MKHLLYRLMALMMIVMLLTPPAGAVEGENGEDVQNAAGEPAVPNETCGGTYADGIAWFYDDGTLTISAIGGWADMRGTDAFNVFYDQDIPWYGVSEYVKTIVVLPGVMSIGSAVFISCDNVETVSLPASVSQIGQDAFDMHHDTVKDVWYLGSEQDWNSIEVDKVGYLDGDGICGLENAQFHYHAFQGVSGGHRYIVERLDCAGALSKDGAPAEAACFYDKVTLETEKLPAAKTVNEAIEAAMNAHVSDTQQYINENNAGPDLIKTVENQSVFIHEDLICIQQLELFAAGGRLHEWYHAYNFDSVTGEPVTLPGYLGLSGDETREIVNAVIQAQCDPSTVQYPDNDPDEYKYYIDDNGQIHLTFSSYEVGIGSAQDFILDYMPAPRVISQPEPEYEEDDDSVRFSARCYGQKLSYEWEYSDDGGTQWIPADCAEPVLEIRKADAVEGRLYRCAVFNDAGRVVTEPVGFPAAMMAAQTAAPESGAAGAGPNLIWIAAAAAAALLLLLALLFVLRRRRKANMQGKDLTVTSARKPPEPAGAPGAAGPKFCPRCGTPRKNDQAFCSRCGHSFRQNAAEREAPKRG